MRPDLSVSNLLAARYRRLFEAGEKTLRAETRRFLEWLFDEPPIRPATIELLRRDRADAVRFVEHQSDLFLRIGSLAHDLLDIYPHGIQTDTFVCQNPRCQEHLQQLDDLLRAPRTVDGDWLADTEASVDATPISAAIEHLRWIEQEHARMADDVPDDTEIEAFRVALVDVWLRHRVGLQRRIERLRASAARSLRELTWWTGLVGVGARETHMTASRTWHHLRQVHLELQSIVTSAQEVECLLTAFKHRSESVDATRLIEHAKAFAAQQGDAAVLTSELTSYLQHHGIPAWSGPQANEATARSTHSDVGPLRPVVIDSVVCSGRSSDERVRTALRRLHAVMLTVSSRASISQAFLVLFRLAGPEYSVPARLEFDRFSIRLLHVDLAREATSSTRGLHVVPLGRQELMGEVDPTPVTPPGNWAESFTGVCLVWRLEDVRLARRLPVQVWKPSARWAGEAS